MTQIAVDHAGGRWLIEISGHARYDQTGRDIVCAAASVLAYTVLKVVHDAQTEGEVQIFYEQVEPGCFVLDFQTHRQSEKKLYEVLSALMKGFELLAEAYPEHITFDF